MANENEPRALTAALSQPAFTTRGGGIAMHVADRHVERWAPEAGGARQRPMRNLGFVDRLISPWIETAQRSASMRLFSQYQREGTFGERAPAAVSWVFPRPWYQDELDWMAAARQAPPSAASDRAIAPSLLTTRGTYVAPQVPPPNALPAALYEYVAPSLSIAQPAVQPEGVGHGGPARESMRAEAYSPIVSLAAVHAAEVMSRAIAPALAGGARDVVSRPALRNVLSAMIDRASARVQEPTRLSMQAPELVTPPAPRAADTDFEAESAIQLAERSAEQRAQIAEVQRIARQSAERELTARATSRTDVVAPEVRAAAIRAEAELRERAIAARQDQERRQGAADQERATQRAAAHRLHEQARAEAAAHARTPVAASSEAAPQPATGSIAERQAPAEVAAALAALPPELARLIGQRPDRAMHAIGELNEALRTVELLARGAAAGTQFESTRGPRLMMPAGLGGLVAAVDRATMVADQPAAMTGQRALAPLAFGPTEMPGAAARAPRTPALPWLVTRAHPTTALDATVAAAPAALTHVAWADRWLARFAGASQQSLDTLSAAAGPTRMQALAAAAPSSVFVSPAFDPAHADTVRPDPAGRSIATAVPAMPVPTLLPSPAQAIRYDDSAETPDDVFAAISAAATQARTTTMAAGSGAPTEAPAERATWAAADAIAHAAPGAPGSGFAAQLASSPFAPALRHVLPLAAAPSFDVRALFGGGVSATYLAGLLAASSQEIEIGPRGLPSWATWLPAGDDPAATAERAVPAWDAAYVAPDDLAGDDAVAATEQADAARQEALAPLTTLRSALLSWDVDPAQPATHAAPTSIATTTSSPITTSTARAMIDAMSLPLLGDLESSPVPSASSWTAPGMVASRAHAWSVAQERSTSDLSLDFVTPELVLAARVYGLGPTEAAQAARLALAGPGHLTAMAGTVDRTFVQAMAIDADRRAAGTRERLATAYPVAAAAGSGSAEVVGVTAPATVSTGAAFGVDRKTPRGAFLWPSATVAALGLHAAAPDGEQSMSVAALELLAAQAVAEIGTYAALHEPAAGEDTEPADRGREAFATAAGASPTRRDGAPAAEPAEAEVLGAAAALVPASRRGRFDALYVALGQSAAGRSWSPAARAARALALAGRDPEGPVSAHERAAMAWEVLPVVYAAAGESFEEGGGSSGPVTASRGVGPAVTRSPRTGEYVMADPWGNEMRPGLGALSARAGEALGSYVTPVAAPAPAASTGSSAPAREREVGAVLRPPTAAHELVRTGRPAGRHGGGEVEIPPWFEAAARKMLEDRSGTSDGISLAELTLVSAAPSSHIAASTRGVPSAAPQGPAQGTGSAQPNAAQIDIEKLANEIYRHILVLMDVARARNGEPYL